MEKLANYPWPGNIRQLKNAVEQMAVMTIGSMINEDKLPEQITEYLEKEKVKGRGVFFDDLVEDYKKPWSKIITACLKTPLILHRPWV